MKLFSVRRTVFTIVLTMRVAIDSIWKTLHMLIWIKVKAELLKGREKCLAGRLRELFTLNVPWVPLAGKNHQFHILPCLDLFLRRREQ